MYQRILRLTVTGISAILFAAACTAEATPPPVDTIGTVAAQLASDMLTQTVAAYSPTVPSATASSIPTETPEPTKTKDPSRRWITVVNHTGCYFGPGPAYTLESYINVPKRVYLLGIGSVEGWYIIKNPYFYAPCWVAAADVTIDEDVDMALVPIMTPGH